MEAAADAHEHIEAQLRTHERVLVRLEQENPDVKGIVEGLVSDIQGQVEEAVNARVETEINLIGKEDATVKISAEQRLEKAKKSLEEVSSLMQRLRGQVGEKIMIEAQAQLELSEELLLKGEAKYEQQEYKEAFQFFQQSVRVSREAEILLKTGSNIDLDIGEDTANIEETIRERQEAVEGNIKAKLQEKIEEAFSVFEQDEQEQD